ncbi:MAG TPA: glycosyl hydrolase [Candidatus Anammoximicrobium sp.]|nr:glycosyl hydrolase [Candidatus Anammoximicrobium sp.]
MIAHDRNERTVAYRLNGQRTTLVAIGIASVVALVQAAESGPDTDASGAPRQVGIETQFSPLEQAFTQSPADARPWCYWYWMNGNVTREGIVADLQAMHDVGVGGVFLMDIGIHPAGPVAYRSPRWYELVKRAVREAQRLGIQVGFHCPGWSASGGPWVTPEMAMQELTWSETLVDGGREISVSLSQPPTKLDYYRDIVVLAFPLREGDDWTLRDLKPTILDTDGKPVRNAAAAYDGDTNTVATLPEQLELVFDRPISARTVFIRAARANGGFSARLLAWDDAPGTFRQVAQVRSYTSGPFSAQIGATTFPAVQASRFRLDFGSRKPGGQAIIEELDLRGGYRDPQWVVKTGFATDQVDLPGKAEQVRAGDVIPVDQVFDLTKYLAADGTWTSGGIRAWPDWLLRGQPRPEPRRLTFAALKHWSKDDRLLPSGLLGPVTVETTIERELGP